MWGSLTLAQLYTGVPLQSTDETSPKEMVAGGGSKVETLSHAEAAPTELQPSTQEITSRDEEVIGIVDIMQRSADREEGCTLRHSESKKLINLIDSLNNDVAKKEERITYLHNKVDQVQLKLQSLCDEHNVQNVDQLQLKLQSLCDEHNVENVDQLQLKLQSLRDEQDEIKKELSEALNKIARLENEQQMLSKEDEKFLAIYEAEAERQPDCCKLCNAKEIHGDPYCMNCGHLQSSHRERCSCDCTEFKGEKKGNCSECSHPRAQHTKKRCTSCDNCGGFEKHTIALSHAYPKAVLKQICGDENIRSIFDGRRYEAVTAATCKRHQLCTKCELSFSTIEGRFAERLQGCLSDPPCDDGQIRQVLLFSTFRAFQHSVRYGQFKICYEDGHACKKVYHKIRSWIVRAKKAILDSAAPKVTGIHHISTVTPIPPKHLSEFPIVCEVEVQDQCYPIIYAQIPPLYWAYSLDENPTITETLRVNFAEVIEVVNAELVNERKIFFAEDVQACHWKEESCKKQTEIETKKFEWNELSDEVTKMKKDCAQCFQPEKFPHTHGQVKEKEHKEREAYNALHTLQINHVPLEGLVLVIAYLSSHCLKVKIDAPKPQATFCT